MRLPLDWDRVFAKAAELSPVHMATLLTRSLDLLHVASATALPKAADQHHVGERRAAGDRQALAVRRPLEVEDVLLGEWREPA
jgi:hypothetical protein